MTSRAREAAEGRKTVELMGVEVDAVTVEQAVNRMLGWAERADGRTRFVVFTGFHGLWVAQNHPEFRATLNAADLFCPDGMALVVLSRLAGRPLPERAPGPDVMRRLLDRSSGREVSSFFLGDTDDTLRRLERRIDRDFGGHEVVGTLSPPFRDLTDAEEQGIVDRINAAEPDILWVALGLPKQERWIERNRGRLEVPVAAGVGAGFRFLSGKVRRAPQWLGNMGLEWAWRLALEPRKLWRRTMIEAPKFAVHALRWATRVRLTRSRTTADEDEDAGS